MIRDRVRILHLAGRPSWDERFLRSMLRRDPNVDLVSFFILRTETDEQPWNHDDLSLIPFPTFEIFEEQLRSFDLVIFQNFNYAPYGVEPFLPNVRDYVEEGGAIAMIGGDLSFASGGYGLTALRDVLPVELPPAPPTLEGENDTSLTTDLFKPRLTPEGHTHPVTSLLLDPRENEARWGKLPPLEGINRVPRAKPNAATLLAHPTLKGADGKPAPVLVAGDAGKGRALALLTDSVWHWGFPAAGEGDDGRAFQRFWENAIRWLVRDPALTLLHIDLERQEYRRNQPISARVRAVHADYTPAANVEVSVDVVGAGSEAGAKPLRSLQATTDGEGETQAEIGALPPGAYRLTGHATHRRTRGRAGRDLRGAGGRSRAGRRGRARSRAARAGAGERRRLPVRRAAAPDDSPLARRPHRTPADGRDLVAPAVAAARSRAPHARVDAPPPLRPRLGRFGGTSSGQVDGSLRSPLPYGNALLARTGRLGRCAAVPAAGARGRRTASASPATGPAPRRRTRQRPSCSRRSPPSPPTDRPRRPRARRRRASRR